MRASSSEEALLCIADIASIEKSFIAVIKKVNDGCTNLQLTRKAYIPIIVKVEIRGLINLMNDEVFIS